MWLPSSLKMNKHELMKVCKLINKFIWEDLKDE
jgi:hypothetical protein